MKLTEQGRTVFQMCILFLGQTKQEASHSEDEIKSIVDKFSSCMNIGREESALVINKLIESVGVIKEDGESIINNGVYTNHDPNWYSKVKGEHCEWFGAYKAKLSQKNWSPNVIAELDRSSDVIMNFLGNPSSEAFNVRGLIMGDVQSGKTANFIALCCKAADAGYRVIIVTAGIIEKLRQQTQGRLEKEFINLLQNKRVVTLTGDKFDFKKEQGNNPVDVFRNDLPVLCVVKKNVSVLQHLLNWLKKGVRRVNVRGELALPHPLLFIDDEADNASINTKATQDSEGDPTRTNALIREILKSFRRSSYVGITATPFANIFIDPDSDNAAYADDLFPKNFVFRLTTPSNYLGTAEIFADGSPYLREINDIEEWLPAKHRGDDFPSVAIPESLQDAIGYFLLINGVMDVMETIVERIPHRTMMIHISRFISMQNRLGTIIENHVKRVIARIANYCGDVKKAASIPEIARMKQLWDDNKLSLVCDNMSWKDFLGKHLLNAVTPIEVCVVNSGGATKLDYSNGDKRYIAVGGNSLSRGLTLEGLVVSYFRRNSLMCDTLLQMGRWCGYRGDTKRLVQIWLEDGARDCFGYAESISEELSEMFHKLVEQGASPKDYAFKIRRDPSAMLPTARNKMYSTSTLRIPVDMSGHAIETPRIPVIPETIRANNEAVCNFLINNKGYIGPNDGWTDMCFYRNVPKESILSLLEHFKAGATSYGFVIPNISDYIASKTEKWDVAINVTDKDAYFDDNGNLPFKIMKSSRKLVCQNNEILISGTKLKVTSGGAMRYTLPKLEANETIESYRNDSASHNQTQKMPPDGRFLQKAHNLGRNPLLVLQYVEGPVEPTKNDVAFFALSLGFPGSRNESSKEDFILSKRASEFQNELGNEEEE